MTTKPNHQTLAEEINQMAMAMTMVIPGQPEKLGDKGNAAGALIKAEIERLEARRVHLETGIPEHEKQIVLQQAAIQSLKDEIGAIGSTVDELRLALAALPSYKGPNKKSGK
jgi:hypothetical protein